MRQHYDYGSKTRTDEIMILMQGRHVPKQRNITTEPLLNVREKPCSVILHILH